MTAVLSHEISCREEFSLLCDWRHLGRVIEIGVDRAEFAVQFLERSRVCHNFIGIDPYTPYYEFPWDREYDYQVATAGLERTKKNCKLIRDTSENAARIMSEYRGDYFGDSPGPDFIYIDGDHSAGSVTQDLELWFPLLADHGIIAGHDYFEDHPGVMEAIDNFFVDKVVYKTHERMASWYVYKSGIPSSDWSRIVT